MFLTGIFDRLTPTQIASRERSKAFKARIEHMAALLKAPVVVSTIPISEAAPLPEKRKWFLVVDDKVVRPAKPERTIKHPAPFVSEIIDLVGNHFKISRNDICSARRTAKLVQPRQIAMYLAKELTGRSLPDIGRRFGGRDHTTVLYAVRKMTRRVDSDPSFAGLIASFRSQLVGDLA